ncbi:hypothetical protein EGW08_017516, partial [Elysia chlorotica]
GILQGTSSLLLAFDESEVRKIIRVCKNVLEYLAITEVVDRMQDLVTFVKNLSPGLTTMTHEVDNREKELTHQVHRDMLIRSLAQVKALTPMLISGIKVYITAVETNQGWQEAQNTRDYTVRKMADEIHEIIRVLQLTTYDEDEWDADDLTVMKKCQNTIEGKMKSAHDWLLNPAALVGSLGDKALRQIIEDSRKIADRCTNPADRDLILRSASDVESMVNALSELRTQGKGSSPQAVSLARGIQDKLKELQTQTARGIANTEHSGFRKPAPTVDGKVEQARQWLANPALDDKGLGTVLFSFICWIDIEVLTKAKCCTKILTNQLADLCHKGMGNTPQAKALARNLTEKLASLKTKIQDALVSQVADDFIDTTTPLKQLSEAAVAPLIRRPRGSSCRHGKLGCKVHQFADHAARLADTANSVATAGGCPNKQTVEAIFKNSNQVKDLTPQVINAARVVFANPDNTAAIEHFDLLKKQWADNMDNLRGLMDEAVDSRALIHAQEEGILRDTERIEDGIRARDSPQIAQGASNIARRADRVLQVAEMEAQNSEDPTFVDRLNQASDKLSATIAPDVQMAKAVAMNPADSAAASNWRKQNQALITAVGEVKDSMATEPRGGYYDDRYPPPPDMSQLHISGDHAPPRPPPPQEHAPPRPPPPETDDEDEMFFPLPQPNQPIMVRQTAFLDVPSEGGTKKDLIATAKGIAAASEEVTRLAKKLAAECTDRRMRTNLLNVCERIPTIGTQLKILSTVKATMLGAQEPIPAPDGSEIACGSEEDQEATEMLVGNAQNLMQAVKETVRTAEAASIKIRVDSGYTIRWARKRPWYT